jgi:aminotransferase
VFVAPGSGYGARGEGFVRFSLTVADDRLAEAMERIGRALA